MSIAERYSRASTSSHLKMQDHQTGDIDVVTAAGWVSRVPESRWLEAEVQLGRSLGVILLRCRGEWDMQRAQMEQAEANAQAGVAAVKAALLAVAKAEKGEGTGEPLVDIAALREANAAELQTSRSLIMMRMESLPRAMTGLLRLGVMRANRRSMTLQPEAIARCAASVMDVWIDQRCDACAGRGYNGGAGLPQIKCRACGGMRVKRRVFPTKSTEENTLGEWLLNVMNEKYEVAQQKISRALR